MDERRSWFERTFEDTKKIVLQAGRRAIRRYPMLREDLDDLIQDTYLELYRKSDQLRAHPNLPGWLVETLNRKAKNRARKRMRELNRRISMDYPPASFEPDGDLLCDSSKFGKSLCFNTCSLDQVDALISDQPFTGKGAEKQHLRAGREGE